MLHLFLISREKLRNKKYLVLVLLLACAIGALAVAKANRQGPGSDFEVYWQTGLNFFDGHLLYVPQPPLTPFIYPPFAALLFQVLGVLPLKVAMGLFFALNFCLFFFSICLIRWLYRMWGGAGKRLQVASALAGLAAFKYFWNNINMGQINEVVLVLCLVGVGMAVKRRETLALMCLVGATFIKVIPGLFVLWYLVRRGTWRSWFLAGGLSLVGVGLPVLFRGAGRGVADLVDYYSVFLQKYQEGKVDPIYSNQSLAAALHRMFSPSDGPEGLDFMLFELPDGTIRLMHLLLFGLLVGGFLALVLYLRMRQQPVSGFEIAVVFLTMHLLSGLTWQAHLVSLLWVYATLFMTDPRKLPPFAKAVTYGLYGLIFVHAIMGRDVIGQTGHFYWGGYNMEVWLMLLLLGYSYYGALTGKGYPLPAGTNKEHKGPSPKNPIPEKVSL